MMNKHMMERQERQRGEVMVFFKFLFLFFKILFCGATRVECKHERTEK